MWKTVINSARHTASIAAFCLLAVSLAEPAMADEGKVTLELTYVAAGIGYQTGTATVTLHGKSATFNVKGGHLVGGGASAFKGTGTVTGAKSLADLEGKFTVTRASISAIVGETDIALRNDRGVKIKVNGTNTGIGASVGLGTVTFSR